MHLALTKPTADPDLNDIKALVAGDMTRVDRLIERRLHSEVVLIDQVSRYIVHSGGKRLRPMLVLLSTGSFGYPGEQHISLAAIVEFIHTATLLHDDVVDASLLRRGQETANALWGNEASVLVGDFLYSRAFQMMVELGSMRIMEILADTTNAIAEGEVLQLLNCHDPETSEARYLRVVQAKTAKLFEAAGRLGAVLSGAPGESEQALASYGHHLGTAFQVIDDVLDYRGSADEIGKNVGDDLSEGKPTLPLIYAMAHASSGQVAVIREAIESGGLDHLGEVIEAVESTRAIAYTAGVARAEADRALGALRPLPASPHKDALEALAEFSVSRSY